MSAEVLAFLIAATIGATLFLAVRHARSEGSPWLASWAVLMTSAGLIALQADLPEAIYLEHWIGPWFPALQLAGARHFVGRETPRWVAPATLAIGVARALLVALGLHAVRYPLALAFDTLLFALAIATLARAARSATDWRQHAACAGTVAIAALNAWNYRLDAGGTGASSPLWTAWTLVGIPVFSLQVGLVHARAEERAAEALRAAREEATRVLAGGVAHDFNNLLAVILGNAERALEQIAIGRAPGARQPLVELGGAVERGATLTRRLLEHVGSVPRVIRVVDVRALVESVVGRARAAAGREIALTAAAGLPAGRADRTLLETAIELLIDNALEAGADAPVRVSVRDLSTREGVPGDGGTRAAPGRYVAIDVSDAGSGIPDPVRARVFEPFFSTKELGRGLGLSAVAGIARALGGAVFLESRAGAGTTASLWVPAAPVSHTDPPDAGRSDADAPHEAGASSSGSARFVIQRTASTSARPTNKRFPMPYFDRPERRGR